MVCDQARAGKVRHLRYLCKRGWPQCPLDWRDREGVDGAGQRIICGSSPGGKSGGPGKHTLKRLSARFHGPSELGCERELTKWQTERKQQLLLVPRKGSERDW